MYLAVRAQDHIGDLVSSGIGALESSILNSHLIVFVEGFIPYVKGEGEFHRVGVRQFGSSLGHVSLLAGGHGHGY